MRAWLQHRSDPPAPLSTLNGNDNHHYENQLLQSISESSKIERVHVNKESAHDAEAKAAKQRELIPYETRVQQFRDMLVEKEVGVSSSPVNH